MTIVRQVITSQKIALPNETNLRPGKGILVVDSSSIKIFCLILPGQFSGVPHCAFT